MTKDPHILLLPEIPLELSLAEDGARSLPGGLLWEFGVGVLGGSDPWAPPPRCPEGSPEIGDGVKEGIKNGVKDGIKEGVKDGFNPLLPAGSPQRPRRSRGCFSPSPFAVFS